MSDIKLMTALILQHAEAVDPISRVGRRVTEASAERTAQAMWANGFRMMHEDVDDKQDASLAELEKRIVRLEGYAGIPPYFEIQTDGRRR